MNIVAKVNTSMSVNISVNTKKKKNDHTYYQIFLSFVIYHNTKAINGGLISTSLGCKVADWNLAGKRMTGGTKGEREHFNSQLLEKLNTARLTLERFEATNKRTLRGAGDVTDVIKGPVYSALSGKPRRGTKNNIQSKFALHTIDYMLEKKLASKKLSDKRQKNYQYAIRHLHAFFNGLPAKGMEQTKSKTPLVPDITSKDMKRFKQWYKAEYPGYKTTTYFSQIIAVFNFAVFKEDENEDKEVQCIEKSPCYNGFRENEKPEEYVCMTRADVVAIENLTGLSESDERMRCSLLLLYYTGMGYGDLLSVNTFHIDLREGLIRKRRNKNDVLFVTGITSKCKKMMDYLLLTKPQDKDNHFGLPSIEHAIDTFNTIALRAGIVGKKVKTYTPRHSFAVHFRNDGCSLDVLQKILGHEPEDITTKVYAPVTDELVKKAFDEIEQKRTSDELKCKSA